VFKLGNIKIDLRVFSWCWFVWVRGCDPQSLERNFRPRNHKNKRRTTRTYKSDESAMLLPKRRTGRYGSRFWICETAWSSSFSVAPSGRGGCFIL